MSGPAPSIQYSWDGPGTLGAPSDGLYLRWNQSTGAFEMASAGVSDHGGLTGLADDDHTQYALLAGRSGGQTLVGGAGSGEALTLTSTSHATKGNISFNGGLALVTSTGAVRAPSFASSTTTTSGLFFSGGSSEVPNIRSFGATYFSADGGGANSAYIHQRVLVTAGASTYIPLTVRGAASQAANLQEWQDSAATVLSRVDSTGRHVIGSLTLGSTLAMSSAYVWRLSGGSDTFAFQSGSSVPYLTLSNTATNQLVAAALSAAKVPLTVDGFASQTANMTEWRNSTSAVLASVSAAGGALAQSYVLVSSGVGTWGQAGSGSAIDSWDSVTIRTTVGAAQGNIGVTGTTAFLKISGTNRILANGTGLGFFNTTPVAQQAGIADVAGGATVDAEARTALNSLIAKLEAYGLLAVA